jgi:hypothetical protein
MGGGIASIFSCGRRWLNGNPERSLIGKPCLDNVVK